MSRAILFPLFEGIRIKILLKNLSFHKINQLIRQSLELLQFQRDDRSENALEIFLNDGTSP